MKEADEETTSEKNTCEDAYDKAMEDFSRGYGTFGERMGDIEQSKSDNEHVHYVGKYHSMTEIPEYKEIWECYRAEEDRIFLYRDRCKDEFFDLFKKWFWAMWD